MQYQWTGSAVEKMCQMRTGMCCSESRAANM